MNASTASGGSSYSQILRSSAITGGSQVAVYVLSLLKTKAAALILGPSGIGLIGLFSSATTLVAIVAGMGVNASGVGEVASAAATGDLAETSRAMTVVRRLSWAVGVLGWLLIAALAVPISNWTFGSDTHQFSMAILGSVVLCTVVGGGYATLLRGMRRIGDLALINLYCAIAGSVVSIALYVLAGSRGIVPALIASAVLSLGINWRFARKLQTQETEVSWNVMLKKSKQLLRLGLAIMWSGFLVTLAEFFTKGLITRSLGLETAGYFQAAWTISGMFAGFILGAMAMDFFPRLSAVAENPSMARSLVNEQTEIGVLLVIPGLMAMLIFAPEIISLVFSAQFSMSAELLPWLLMGVLGKVASWPLGFVALVKREAMWFAVLETLVYAAQLGLVWWLLHARGVSGAAAAFAASQVLYTILYYLLSRRLIDFRWTGAALRVFCVCGVMLALAVILRWYAPDLMRWGLGACLSACAAIYTLRGVYARLPQESRISSMISNIPFSNILLRSR